MGHFQFDTKLLKSYVYIPEILPFDKLVPLSVTFQFKAFSADVTRLVPQQSVFKYIL